MTDRAAKDRYFMKRALALAKNALGYTSPNPIVGAVIVKNGRIIGSGWHHKAGAPHAESEAIRSLRSPGMAKNATLYVTLEPCSSFGRTPPCCDAIIQLGFKRVVIGCPDPNPKHAGRGIGLLREYGIEVTCPVEEAACLELNKAFFKWITVNRPYVLLKMAETLDGRIATAGGSSRWITGDDAARKRVRELRLWSDAILAGAETFRLDHPQLTARDDDGNVLKEPVRYVASHHAETIQGTPGFKTVSLDGKSAWDHFLKGLGQKEILSLLIEGGGEVAASALHAGIVDEVEFHVAPKLLGGRNSRPCVGGDDPQTISEAIPLTRMNVHRLGKNLRINAIPQQQTDSEERS